MSVGILLYHSLKAGNLPKEYQEVNWIRSSGGSGKPYIDTGYTPNEKTRVKIRVQWYYLNNSSWGGFGSGESATSRSFSIYNYSNALNICYGSQNIGASTSGHWDLTLYHIYTIDFNRNVCTVIDDSDNNRTKTWTLNNYTFTAPYTMYLFGVHRATSGFAEVAIHGGVEIYDDDVLVRYLIPCYRKADNVIGYYDTVGKTFYSSPTGKFWRGTAIKRLPSAYQQVESIGSSGTQYLNTGLDLSGGYHIHAYMIFKDQSNLLDTYFGTENGGSPYACVMVREGYSSVLQFNTGEGGLSKTSSFNGHGGSFLELYAQNSASKIVWTPVWGSESTWTGSYPSAISSYPLIIFASSLGSGVSRFAQTTMYEFTVWDGNENLVGDFVPCYRKSDGVIGAYDLVTKQFLTNLGSGDFSKGSSLNPAKRT